MFKKPFVKRCESALGRWNIPQDTDVRQVLLPSIPPWERSPIHLESELISPINRDLSNEEKKEIALETIRTRYPLQLKIYTDGSKGDESTTAAMWIPSLNEP